MRVALFVPCYIEHCYPRVAAAALRVLRAQGVAVDYPRGQACCGQPMSNMGCRADAAVLARRFVRVFHRYDWIVVPSGSCTAMVRNHYAELLDGAAARRVASRTRELCEFLHEVIGEPRIAARFPHRVGLHQSCHGLRELRLARASELMAPPRDTVRAMLERVEGLELVELERPDECCGFGGTFAVTEPDVSCRMGRDRVADHRAAGAEVLTSADMSCLMHLDGLIRRDGAPLRVLHVAEILAGTA